MNAKRARQLTEENIRSATSSFISQIDNAIEAAIKKRTFVVRVYTIPTGEELEIIKQKYQSDGFTWKYHSARDQRDDSFIDISW